MDPQRIVISAMGAICSLGNDTQQQRGQLFTNAHGLRTATHLKGVDPKQVFGEVELSNDDMKDILGKELPGSVHSRTALLALLAAREAVQGVGYIDMERTMVISASTVGGMDLTEAHYRDWKNGQFQNAHLAGAHDVAHHTQLVTDLTRAKGGSLTISTACSSSANAIMTGACMLQNGLCDHVIAGGADALCRFTVEGFRSLSAMDPQPCRPFSDDRAGLNLGEAAAYLVLEREDTAQALGHAPIALLAGWANANDAHHQTATSPEGNGPYKAMQHALERANLRPEMIDHINAHGTATPNNDETELKAMQRCFPNALPNFTSTKAKTGHTLAAAGALEGVFSILSIQEQLLPPLLGGTINGSRSEERPSLIRNVLSNSFGFGGNDSALIFSLPDQ